MAGAVTPLREGEIRLLAIGMGATLIPILDILPPWVLLLAFLFALWRFLPIWWGFAKPPLAFLRLPVGLACFWGVYAEYGMLNGIEPGTALLTLMLGLKLVETRQARDGMVMAMLAYILIMAVFLSNQDLLPSLWLAAVCCFQTAALLRLTRLSEPGPLRPSLLTAGKLLLQALPIAIILFVLFPRVPGPLWGTPTPEQRTTTGLSESMSPGSISELAQSNALAFRATFPNGEAPNTSQLYWRGPVFQEFDGQEWREGQMPSRAPAMLPVGEPVRQEITLEPHGQDWMIALDVPGGELPDDSTLRADFRLAGEDSISERKRYQVDSWLNQVLDPDLPDSWRSRLTELPEDSNPQTHELAREWLAEVDEDPMALADRILDHFNQQSFYYTLEPPLLGRDSMDEFLFETQRGFCEHYAAAFTVMMRAADIPARVVTGYVGGDYNPMAGHYRVLQSNAHAWAEIWVPDNGWVRIDPTTAIHPDRIESAVGPASSEDVGGEGEAGFSWRELSWQLELTWDTIQARWDGWFLAYGPDRQRDFLDRLGLPSRDVLRLSLIMMGLIAAAGLLLWLGLSLRQAPPKPRDPVERAWQRFNQRMRRAGLGRQPHEGPMEWLQRLEQEAPAAAQTLAPLMNRFRRARYSNSGDASLPKRLRDFPQRRLRQLAKQAQAAR